MTAALDRVAVPHISLQVGETLQNCPGITLLKFFSVTDMVHYFSLRVVAIPLESPLSPGVCRGGIERKWKAPYGAF